MGTETDKDLNAELIRRLDEAISNDDCCTICTAVKDVLHEIVLDGRDFLPAQMLEPVHDKYARRLLHRDPQGRYTVIVMVWDKGQGTPLHDHAGMWCVECVYRGNIEVISYDRTDDETGPLANFVKETTIIAGIADAGALIPPFEYHTIANAEEKPAVTIHVYGGEMTYCHAFLPVEGGYERVRRELCYNA